MIEVNVQPSCGRFPLLLGILLLQDDNTATRSETISEKQLLTRPVTDINLSFSHLSSMFLEGPSDHPPLQTVRALQTMVGVMLPFLAAKIMHGHTTRPSR